MTGLDWCDLCGGDWSCHESVAASKIARLTAENAALRKRTEQALQPLRVLFSNGPDTPCRTTWPQVDWPFGERHVIECCEVPIADLRDAFDRAEAILRGDR